MSCLFECFYGFIMKSIMIYASKINILQDKFILT